MERWPSTYNATYNFLHGTSHFVTLSMCNHAITRVVSCCAACNFASYRMKYQRFRYRTCRCHALCQNTYEIIGNKYMSTMHLSTRTVRHTQLCNKRGNITVMSVSIFVLHVIYSQQAFVLGSFTDEINS